MNGMVTRPDRRRLLAAIVGVALVGGLLPGAVTPASGRLRPIVAPKIPVSAEVPLSFEINRGQADAQVRFLARGGGITTFLTANEAVLVPAEGPAVRLGLVDANAEPELVGADRLPGVANYLIGDNPSLWHTNVPTYQKIRYRDVYPGVDLIYHSKAGNLEYDFVVAPGADPNRIGLSFDGVDGLALDGGGDLVVSRPGGALRQHRPTLYQDIRGSRHHVDGEWVLDGEDRARFSIGSYDRSYPLVIDPVVTYATYVAGNGADAGNGIAVDASGSAYLTGSTRSTNFPTAASPGSTTLQPSRANPNLENFDAFVTKLSPDGASLVYATYLGGSLDDEAMGIALKGEVAYLTGRTKSPDFPHPTEPAGGNAGLYDAFVAGLNAQGSAVIFSSTFGGEADDGGRAIAMGPGYVFVAGDTCSPDFTATVPQFDVRTPNQVSFTPPGSPNPTSGLCDAGSNAQGFVRPFNITGSGAARRYTAFLGGTGQDVVTGISVYVPVPASDYFGPGRAYITGFTRSADLVETPLVDEGFPTTPGAPQRSLSGAQDAFVAEINDEGKIVYSTYLGGQNSDAGQAISVDPVPPDLATFDLTRAFVAGWTDSTDIPIAVPAGSTALQTEAGGGKDAFVAEISPGGKMLTASTYLGGSGDDFARGISIGPGGTTWVTGESRSTVLGPTGGLKDKTDAFVVQVSDGMTQLQFSNLLGGTRNDAGRAIAVAADGSVYIGGTTSSTDFPTKNAAQPAAGDGNQTGDAFVAKIGSSAGLFAVGGTPQAATIGAAFAQPLRALFRDDAGVVVPGVNVTFTAPATGPSGVFDTDGDGTSRTVVVPTGADGVATSPTFNADLAAGTYQVVAQAEGPTEPASFDLTNLPEAPASILAIAGTPQSAKRGTSFATSLAAGVKDRLGNPVSGVNVTFTAPATGPSGVFDKDGGGTSRTVIVPTGATGIAAGPRFTADSTLGTYSVVASVENVASAATFQLTNLAGDPSAIAIHRGGGSATVGTAFSPLEAKVSDAEGGSVPGVNVTFNAPTSGPSGTFPGGASSADTVTNADGIATAPTFVANDQPGSYEVRASAPGAATPASFSLTNVTQPPASIRAIAGTPQRTSVGSTFGVDLQAVVRDAQGSVGPRVEVTFRAPSTGPSATFADGKATATVITDSRGIATAPALTANAEPGSYSVVANVENVDTPAPFSLTNEALKEATKEPVPPCPAVGPPGPDQVAYPAGFSLLGLPGGTRVPTPYRLWGWFDQGEGGQYSGGDPSLAVTTGRGYWKYFACPVLVNFGDEQTLSVSSTLGAYHASLVGNPSRGRATVTGHDFAARWVQKPDGGGSYSLSGFREPQTLAPGEGIWVFSYVRTEIRIEAAR